MHATTFEPIAVLRTRFHKLTVDELLGYLLSAAKSDRKRLVANVNLRAMNFAYELAWYREFINRADLVFCDGWGVLLAARMLGYQLDASHRMTPPDYLEDLALTCAEQDVSIFFLGGRPGVADKAVAKLRALAPQLRVDGHHGHFDHDGPDNQAVVERVNQFAPDLLFVGFGMPLQESWIRRNWSAIDTRVFIPIGAALDFYTGELTRGPRWLTDRGFEWLCRLVTEPRRLGRRYLVDNPLFFFRMVKDHFILPRF